MAEIPAIDLAWEAVNSLGGAPAEGDLFEAGFVTAINEALEAIEALGGKDPARQRHANAALEQAKR